MAKIQCMAEILEAGCLAEGIYSMWLLAPGIAGGAVPGQFISLYTADADRLLPRPISICEIDRERGAVRIVYRAAGSGTRDFSLMKKGEGIQVMGPLGNGYPLPELAGESLRGNLSGERNHIVLIGGGIGIPPLVQLAKELSGQGCEVTAVVGYRNGDTFLLGELEQASERVLVASEDGSTGTAGNVLDAVRAEDVHGDAVCSCGPLPMLRGVKAWGAGEGIPVYLSLEEKMACGIGACLACVCRTEEADSHSKVKNRRVCKDGPVFLAEDIVL